MTTALRKEVMPNEHRPNVYRRQTDSTPNRAVAGDASVKNTPPAAEFISEFDYCFEWFCAIVRESERQK